MKWLLLPSFLFFCGCLSMVVDVSSATGEHWRVHAVSFMRDAKLGPLLALSNTNGAAVYFSQYGGGISSNAAPLVSSLGELIGNIAQAALTMRGGPSSEVYRVTIEKKGGDAP